LMKSMENIRKKYFGNLTFIAKVIIDWVIHYTVHLGGKIFPPKFYTQNFT
jgi:hypothetical protein